MQSERAISSAGSEHLVYTEGVGGSNPSSPTKKLLKQLRSFFLFLYFIKKPSLWRIKQNWDPSKIGNYTKLNAFIQNEKKIVVSDGFNNIQFIKQLDCFIFKRFAINFTDFFHRAWSKIISYLSVMAKLACPDSAIV